MIRERSLESLLLHLIGFILLWEWLRPVQAFGEVINLNVFILFMAICFLFFYFKVRPLFQIAIGAFYIISTINRIFFDGSILNTLWPTKFVKDIFENIGYLVTGEFLIITDPFRTLLLFTLLWLIIYLLHYWIIIRKKMFFFFLLTVIYLSVVDTFAPYNAQNAILRTFVIGLAGIGIVNFFRLMEEERIPINQFFKKKYLVSIGVMVFLSTTVGVLVPKAEPQWPDPIPHIQSFANHHFGKGGRGAKIGYDEDDSLLGGPFQPDGTLVFRAYADNEEYWRVETKDYYTGKGWKQSMGNYPVDIDVASGEVPIYSAEEAYLEEEQSAIVEMVGTKSHIIYPQGLTKLMFTQASSDDQFTYNYTNEKVTAGFLRSIDRYHIIYEKPSFEIYAMKETKNSSLFNREFLERYTQLPDSLPERVVELAKEITANDDNWYDKVKSIERYFHSSQFTYETEDVAIPGPNDDYVDQFLFETRKGYCDNFSTSMVVMLRALGIPSRWVKGYSPGERVGTEGGQNVYEITNNNAHSWVEVYFPRVGWVPFEPTKGFDNPASFYFDLSNLPSEEDPLPTENETPDETPVEPNEPQEPNIPEEPAETPGESSGGEKETFSLAKIISEFKDVFIGGGIVLVVITGLLFLTRRKWYPYWLMYKYRNKNDNESFADAYMALLTQLHWNGFTRAEGQTLRNFADYIDNFYGFSDMTLLTNQYERILYRNEKDGDGFNEAMKKRWIHVLKRMMGKLKE